MRLHILISVAAVSLFVGTAQGVTLLAWDFAGEGPVSESTAELFGTGISTAPSSGVASVGPGLLATNYLSNGLTARLSQAMTLADALAGDDYFSFSIAPDATYEMTLDAVEIRPVSQNRSRSFTLFSDVDGFAAGNELGTFDYHGNFGPATRVVLPTAFAGLVDPVEFRLYIHGFDNPWESVGMGNDRSAPDPYDLVITGQTSAAVVPEPLTLAVAPMIGLALTTYLRGRRDG